MPSGASVSPDFLTSRSYHRFAKSGLAESGERCIFVGWPQTKLAEARRPGLPVNQGRHDLREGRGSGEERGQAHLQPRVPEPVGRNHLWLDPGVTDSQRVVDCLKPFDSTLMKKYPVSTRVNRPENDDQECAREIPIAGPPPRLF